MTTNTLTLFKHKSIIRTYIRTLRRSLKPSEQYIAAQLITNKILTLNNLNQATNIAAFISTDGEIRTDLIIQTLLSINKRIYLPVLPTTRQSRSLLFAQYTLSTPLIRNRFNIYEPKHNYASVINITMLDIILIPLVAFDEHGFRLGMGGGFYDKTLFYLNTKPNNICIGLGYDFQKIPTQIFPSSKQDIKLSKIITPYCTYSIYNQHD